MAGCGSARMSSLAASRPPLLDWRRSGFQITSWVCPEDISVGNRLDSWKQIAAYLGRDVRTVQRWAHERRLPVHRLPGGDRPRVFGLEGELDEWLRAASRPRREETVSLAVLPFMNLSGSTADRRFGDGLAEDVINELVRIKGLRVIARTSSFAIREQGEDVRQTGARLGVGWLLEGSVQREGGRVRVSAQLVSAKDGCHVWSEQYDRELGDTFALQDEIARSITTALELELVHTHSSRRPVEPEAYDLWLKGRTLGQQFTSQSFTRARKCFESAIETDPGFARPHFGLADLLFHGAQFGVVSLPEALPRARAALTRSLELDDRFGEAQALLGVFRGVLDYDWQGADSAFRHAFELSPGSASVLSRHAWYCLVPRMRITEALVEARDAVALDPLSPFSLGLLGLVLVTARRYHRAVEICHRAIQLAPALWWLHWLHGMTQLLDGEREQGLQQCRRISERLRQPLLTGALCALLGHLSRFEEARYLLNELEEMAPAANCPPTAFAMACLGAGDDRVHEWLERAVETRDPLVTHLPSLPFFDRLRDDARFEDLLTRMGLSPFPKS